MGRQLHRRVEVLEAARVEQTRIAVKFQPFCLPCPPVEVGRQTHDGAVGQFHRRHHPIRRLDVEGHALLRDTVGMEHLAVGRRGGRAGAWKVVTSVSG